MMTLDLTPNKETAMRAVELGISATYVGTSPIRNKFGEMS